MGNCIEIPEKEHMSAELKEAWLALMDDAFVVTDVFRHMNVERPTDHLWVSSTNPSFAIVEAGQDTILFDLRMGHMPIEFHVYFRDRVIKPLLEAGMLIEAIEVKIL